MYFEGTNLIAKNRKETIEVWYQAMSRNKMIQRATKRISGYDINMKKNYKVVRKVLHISHPAYRKRYYCQWDQAFIYKEREIPVRVFATDSNVRPVLIFFHGGGWVTGSVHNYDRVCANLAKVTGHKVVAVDYSLAPEYKFPYATKECYYITKEIIQNSKELFQVEAEDITLIGDSAGANLAAVVSLMARDYGEFQVKRQILIYPAVNNDFTVNSQFESIRENGTDYILTSKRMCDYMDLYQSKEEDQWNPYFAPLLAKDLSRQPDTLIITAGFDPLRDEGEEYGKRLYEAGNQVEVYRFPNQLHGFIALPLKCKAVSECYGLIQTYLKKEVRKKHEKEQKNTMAEIR